MSEVTGWITVNGQHIPLMKGESKAKAVARFIKGKRDKKLDDAYYKARKEGKNWKEANEATRQKIKGYSDDPYNKVGKANEAYEKKWESMSKYVNDAKKDYEDAKRYDTYYDKEKIRSKYPEKLSKVERAKLLSETRSYEDRNERNIEDKRRLLYTLENDRKSLSRSVYDAELNKEYKGYKLKATTEKITPGENALQRYAQVSNSSYNISNIKAKELPSGAIHITTKSGKDISTISPKALTTQQKNELRKKGILK